MKPIKLENGKLLIPKRAEDEEGLVGDGMIIIGSSDEGFDRWLEEIEQVEEEE